MSRRSKYVDTNQWLLRTWERRIDKAVIPKGYAVACCSDGNVLKSSVVSFVHNSEYTKSQWVVHFKQVDCMTCEL